MNDAVNFGDGDSFVVDMTSVEEASFEAMPRGNYNVVVSEAEFRFSNEKSSPMWSLTLEVTDGDHVGRKLFTHVVFTPKALPFAKKSIAALRPELNEQAFDPRDDEIVDSLIGVECTARVTVKMYDGEKRNNVAALYPLDTGASGGGFV